MSEARLIIVDDEPVVLQLLAAVFRGEEGLQVVRCADGASALAAIEEGVDVLLTDKNLPDVGGLELARRAKERQPDSEVIIITGYASLDTALAAMELDVFDYIVKPPKDILDVKRKVKQALDKQAMSRENKRLMSDLTQRNLELERALTELKEVQAELIQSEKLAGIGTLAAGIAHEISSPLFGVMGLAEAILDEEERELVRGYASEIVEYARSIKDIVVQLSGYSRAAESEYHTTIDLPKVVEDAVKLVVRSTSFDPARVRLEVEDPGGGLYVNARTSEIQQVFVNLVKNAIEAVVDRYGPGGGCVTVRVGATPAPRAAVFAEVADDGAGIPADRLAVIFDPFYTTKPPGRGTGLGLNIVYRILTKYRGQITVESTEGEGTTFHVRFPIEPDPVTSGD
ncbi:MAG: response regulator [Alphaproteobacteria bacterium]|nr:response regulator [Alphaproteobacteria bacterium]